VASQSQAFQPNCHCHSPQTAQCGQDSYDYYYTTPSGIRKPVPNARGPTPNTKRPSTPYRSPTPRRSPPRPYNYRYPGKWAKLKRSSPPARAVVADTPIPFRDASPEAKLSPRQSRGTSPLYGTNPEASIREVHGLPSISPIRTGSTSSSPRPNPVISEGWNVSGASAESRLDPRSPRTTPVATAESGMENPSPRPSPSDFRRWGSGDDSGMTRSPRHLSTAHGRDSPPPPPSPRRSASATGRGYGRRWRPPRDVDSRSRSASPPGVAPSFSDISVRVRNEGDRMYRHRPRHHRDRFHRHRRRHHYDYPDSKAENSNSCRVM
jgi:hypothetical protein